MLKFAQLVVNDKFRSKPGLFSFGPYLYSDLKYHETRLLQGREKAL